jgi:DNA-binding response OmpR family regulator
MSGRSSPSILVVDDDSGVRWVLAAALAAAGYTVLEAADGEEAIRVALRARPDLLIVDLILPKKHGLDVIAELRALGIREHIIAITGVEPEGDAVKAIAAGADTWLRKPLGLDVLEAHVLSGLRRAREYASTTPVTAGDLTYDPLTGEAQRGSREFNLSQIERVLTHLGIRNAGRTLSVEELWKTGWGHADQSIPLAERDIHAVEVAMSRLAAKLNGPGESRILGTTTDKRRRRIGYLFDIGPRDGMSPDPRVETSGPRPREIPVRECP